MSAWKIAKPTTTTDGALLLTSDAGGPYNALLVWFDKDRGGRGYCIRRQPSGDARHDTLVRWGQGLTGLGPDASCVRSAGRDGKTLSQDILQRHVLA